MFFVRLCYRDRRAQDHARRRAEIHEETYHEFDYQIVVIAAAPLLERIVAIKKRSTIPSTAEAVVPRLHAENQKVELEIGKAPSSTEDLANLLTPPRASAAKSISGRRCR